MQFPHSGPQMDSSFASQSGGGLGTGDPPPVEAKPKIQHTQATAITKKIDWKRKPHSDGTGACHVKTFHSRMSSEGMEILDQQINQWLEEHPEIDVKLVTTSVGEWQGKIKEPNLIVQIWV